MKLRMPHPGILLLVIFTLVFSSYCIEESKNALVNPAVTSGWFLLASFAVLGIYGLRKKVPFPPVGKTTTWLQLHLGFGAISTALFFEHVGYRISGGFFEGILFGLYSLLLFSGFLGWLVMRTIPAEMRSDGRESNPSRIPDDLSRLRTEADQWIDSLESTDLNEVLVGSYFDVIRPYLASGCGIVPPRIHPEFRVPRRIVTQIQVYGSPVVLFSSEQFIPVQRMIQEKVKLDLHLIRQRWLRGWLLVHIPLTSVMILMISVHLLLVMAFSAGGGR